MQRAVPPVALREQPGPGQALPQGPQEAQLRVPLGARPEPRQAARQARPGARREPLEAQPAREPVPRDQPLAQVLEQLEGPLGVRVLPAGPQAGPLREPRAVSWASFSRTPRWPRR